MNTHLEMVRDFHRRLGIAQPEYPDTAHLSDMDIVLRQTLLLQCAQETLQAIVSSDMAKMLAGLVDLAYNALAAIACRGDAVVHVNVNWRQDGSVLSIATALSEKVHKCTSGETLDYSTLYHLCQQLAQRFVNADFDKAFQTVHQHILNSSQALNAQNYAQRLQQQTLPVAPDLTDSLYE